MTLSAKSSLILGENKAVFLQRRLLKLVAHVANGLSSVVQFIFILVFT